MEKDIVWPSGKKPRDSPNFLRNKTIRIVAKLVSLTHYKASRREGGGGVGGGVRGWDGVG